MVWSSSRSVVVGGSRSLPASALAFCRVLGSRLAAGQFPVSVGCAPGADLAFVEGFLSVAGSAPWLSVFAAGGPGGVGLPAGLGPGAAVAAAAGAAVSWWAGGARSVALSVRLAVRSRASVAAASVAAVFVLGSPASRGSLGAAAAAARSGLPVFVFCFGFSPSTLPSLPGLSGGSWVSSSLLGFPCWAWSPAQPSLF